MIDLNINAGVEGHFAMYAHGGKRGRVLLAEFDNLILDQGLERMFTTSGGVLSACQIGTGTTPPTAADTSLGTRLASTTTVQSSLGSGTTYVAGPPAYLQASMTFRFAIGTAAGNLTEVGVGWGTGAGGLFSRALIVDGSGNPTTITILSDEQLDVIYTLRLYPSMTDVTGTVTLEGVDYAYKLRFANMNSYYGALEYIPGLLSGLFPATQSVLYIYNSNTLGAMTGVPAGSESQAACTYTLAAYVANSRQRQVEIKLDLNAGNIAGGIGSMRFAIGMRYPNNDPTFLYQISFTPFIPKINTKVLKLNFTFGLGRAA